MLYSYNPTDKENRVSLIWLGLIVLLISWNMAYLPLIMALNIKTPVWAITFELISVSALAIDFYLRWNQKLKLPEYTTEYFGIAQISEHKIYKKSLWAILDLFACIPFELIIYQMDLNSMDSSAFFLRAFQFARIAKIRSVWNLLDFINKPVKLGIFIFTVLMAIHWIACGWMLIMPKEAMDNFTFYTLSLYWSVTTLTTVGYGDITPVTNIGRFYTMGVMLIGVGVYGVIIANISRIMMIADRYTQERKTKLSTLNQYMQHYQIPTPLQKQVFSYYNHVLTKKMNDEDNGIIKDLPQVLQNELEIYSKIKLIKNVHIFKGCSVECLKMIAQKLTQQCYSPNEFIIRKGDQGDTMYIIGHGEVLVTADNRILKTLRPGQFFGEMALLEDRQRTANVQSKAYCDLYTFSKEDFFDVIQNYPFLEQRLKNIYNERVESNLEKAA